MNLDRHKGFCLHVRNAYSRRKHMLSVYKMTRLLVVRNTSCCQKRFVSILTIHVLMTEVPPSTCSLTSRCEQTVKTNHHTQNGNPAKSNFPSKTFSSAVFSPVFLHTRTRIPHREHFEALTAESYHPPSLKMNRSLPHQKAHDVTCSF